MLKEAKDLILQYNMAEIYEYFKITPKQIVNPEKIIQAALKIPKNRLMIKIYSKEELHHILDQDPKYWLKWKGEDMGGIHTIPENSGISGISGTETGGSGTNKSGYKSTGSTPRNTVGNSGNFGTGNSGNSGSGYRSTGNTPRNGTMFTGNAGNRFLVSTWQSGSSLKVTVTEEDEKSYLEKFPPIGKNPELDKIPPIGKNPGFDKFPPIGKNPELEKFPPIRRNPELDNFPPIRKNPENSDKIYENGKSVSSATLEKRKRLVASRSETDLGPKIRNVSKNRQKTCSEEEEEEETEKPKIKYSTLEEIPGSPMKEEEEQELFEKKSKIRNFF